MSYSLKIDYSLFGDSECGYRRFLYNGYLPFDHPDQGVRFELTAEKLQWLNEKSHQIVLQIENALKNAVNDRIWPVDRRLIVLTTYCFLNAMERVKSLFAIHAPEKIRFFTPLPPLLSHSVNTVETYMSRLVPEMYERILILLFNLSGVEISFEDSLANALSKGKAGINDQFLILKRNLFTLWTKYKFLKKLMVSKNKDRHKNKKPLLLILNSYLDAKDVDTCLGEANILFLDNWFRGSEPSFLRKITSHLDPSDQQRERRQWEKRLGEIQVDDEDPILKEVIPFIAKIYPVSLIEGRNYVKTYACNFLKEIKCFEIKYQNIVLSIDHRLWKYESLSALAIELIQNGGNVVASSHDKVTGLLNYGMVLTLDQCLISHYLGNFKKPFISLEKETPEVIQIDSLRSLRPTIKGERFHSLLSIWYFPHYLVPDPQFHFWFYGMENPESFLEVQKNAMMGFNMIAKHPKVKEVVIKLKYDPDRALEKQKYINTIEQLLSDDRSPKIRFVTNMTMQQALPHISIAVHDIFSGGFVETMYAGIPTLAILPQEADIPYRLPDREEWIKLGAFVRNKDELYESLLKWIGRKVPPDYHRMKENFLITCGLGSPTAGEALLSILKDSPTYLLRKKAFE